MDIRIPYAIILFFALITIMSVFLPWAVATYQYGSKIGEVTGVEIAQKDTSFGELVLSQSVAPMLTLGGGLLATMGAFLGLIPKGKIAILLIFIGGIISLVGGFGGLSFQQATYHVYGDAANEAIRPAIGVFLALPLSLINVFFGPIAYGQELW